MKRRTHVRSTEPYRWDGVPVLAYKEDGGTHFKDVTRQILFGGGEQVGAELRYFEIAPGGYSTLERHEHVHSVVIVRGHGRVLVGREIHEIALNSLVYVPSHTWHQFRATGAEPLGFLCLVRHERDRPQRPGAGDLAELRSDPGTAAFIRV
jgi:mannose-6-phosphate isomerase-like protein (cupin superfamily)